MAQLAETTVAERSLTSCVLTRFLISSLTMPGQRHSQPHSDFVGSRMYVCLGVTCHLHLWRNDRGLLRSTAITWGWNGHRIRVSTKISLWRRTFSRRFWPGFELATFRSRVWGLYQEATPARYRDTDKLGKGENVKPSLFSQGLLSTNYDVRMVRKRA